MWLLHVNLCVSLCILQAVSVTFSELSLEHHTICRYDSVSLYDGPSTNSTSLGRFCTVAMSTITSSNSSLLVIFQTDNSNNKGRFSLSWTFGRFIINIYGLTVGLRIATINCLWSHCSGYLSSYPPPTKYLISFNTEINLCHQFWIILGTI